MIYSMARGFQIAKRLKGKQRAENKVYVESIYKGKINWTLDYTYAKCYKKNTAEKLDKEIDDMIHKGLIIDVDIIADN